MRRNTLRKTITVTLVVMAAAMITGISIGASGNRNSQSQSADEQRAIKEAIRQGGYREAARLKGQYVGQFNTNSFLTFDLDSLTKASAAVIIGTPSRNVCRLSANGQVITTDYQVEVQEVVKGNLQQGSTVTVKLPGGKVTFDDGTSAELRTPGFRKMINGSTYVLFLKASKDQPGVFRLTGGPQGLFGIPADNTVIKPHGRPIDPLVHKNKDKDVKSFLKDVRKAGKKYPEPGSCCN